MREKKVYFSCKKVSDIVTHDVVAVDKTATISSVCAHMVRNRVRSVLVLSEGRFIGIVTASDIIFKVLMKGLPEDKVRVSEIMSSPLITINYDASVEDACKIMIEKKIRHLPVVRDGRIIGIVTPTDILRGIEVKTEEEE